MTKTRQWVLFGAGVAIALGGVVELALVIAGDLGQARLVGYLVGAIGAGVLVSLLIRRP